MSGIQKAKQITEEIMQQEPVGTACTIVCIGIIIAAALASCVDSVDSTAKQNRKPEPVYVAHYFDKPAAFRLSTPTQAQMDKLHFILDVEKVRHPERIDTDAY